MTKSTTKAQIVSNIIQFELKTHPAWNPDESFSNRIRNLPLYFLEINHASRDKTTQSVTVTHYVPCRAEMMALVEIIRSCGTGLRVCDIGCGNGFIGSLLAREDLDVFGVDDRSNKQPQISSFYDRDCYKMIETSIKDASVTFDVAFCCWMTSNLNLSPDILSKDPVMIIHVLSPHRQADGSPVTGKPEAYMCPPDYQFLVGWRKVLPKDYFLPLGRKLDLGLIGNLETIRAVMVYVHTKFGSPTVATPLDFKESYDWDIERDLINELRSKEGLPKYRLDVLPRLE